MAHYYVDHDDQGWIKVEKNGSNNVVYKIPYSSIKDGINCPVIKNRFIVYILHGITSESKDYIYVGKSTKGLDDRPSSHDSKYDNWTYCYVLTCENDSFLNDGVIQYLEDTIKKKVDSLSDYYINTTNKTSSNTANKRDIIESNEYLKDIYDRLFVLGLDMIGKIHIPKITEFSGGETSTDGKKEPTKPPEEGQGDPDREYYFLRSSKANAKGYIVDEKTIVVFKGASISPTTTVSFEKNPYSKLRKDLIADGTISNNILIEDHKFDSLSAAAAVLLGRAANGLTEWRDESGVPFKSKHC